MNRTDNRRTRRRRRAFLPPVLVLATLLAGCSRAAPRPNLLLLVVDSLRPDHMGCYGYHRSTTPRLDRLAAEGAQFLNAISQAPWTTPSMASVLTSLYPSTHGVVDMEFVLDGSIETLAEVLRARGYRTGAATPAATLRKFFQLDQRATAHLRDVTPAATRSPTRSARAAWERCTSLRIRRCAAGWR